MEDIPWNPDRGQSGFRQLSPEHENERALSLDQTQTLMDWKPACSGLINWDLSQQQSPNLPLRSIDFQFKYPDGSTINIFLSWVSEADPQNSNIFFNVVTQETQQGASSEESAQPMNMGDSKVFFFLKCKGLELTTEEVSSGKFKIKTSSNRSKVMMNFKAFPCDRYIFQCQVLIFVLDVPNYHRILSFKIPENFAFPMDSFEHLSNVQINCGGENFKCHRLILSARSPVFKAMLEHNTKEKRSGIIEIKDIKPDIMKIFLDLLYTGKVDKITTETVKKLYMVADKYQVANLWESCRFGLMAAVNKNNCMQFVRFGIESGFAEIAEKARSFLKRNISEVLETEEYADLMKDYPTVFLNEKNGDDKENG